MEIRIDNILVGEEGLLAFIGDDDCAVYLEENQILLIIDALKKIAEERGLTKGDE